MPIKEQLDAPLLSNRTWCVAGGCLAFLVVPLFLCAPVTSDTSLFDVQAMTALRGGVLYRDVIEPNLPGVVWIHMAVRSVFGWSSEAIRLFDLLVFAMATFLLCQLATGTSSEHRHRVAPGLFVVVSMFYLTCNEWCHCQRDSWMLLPSACALWLRLQRGNNALPASNSAVVEGLFWGIAFWIKPHVAVPALAVMVVDLRRHDGWKSWLRDTGLVVTGGVTAAIPGIVWLFVNGAWTHFWEMMLEWNPDYLEAGRQRRSLHRVTLMFQRFHPWGLIHLLAIPLAVISLRSAVIRRHAVNEVHRPMLAAVYLAWLIQTFLLQHAMDYIHVPEIILGLCVVAAYPWRIDVSHRRVILAASLLIAILNTPHLRPQRLGVWTRCFSEGSSAEVRSELAQGNFPDWIHLERVRQFLDDEEVDDRDVTCFNVHSIHLHQELGVLPATRYWTVLTPLTMFPRRFDQIMNTIESSSHRFVVLEENETSHDGQVRPAQFPRNYPVVFESGSYKVYGVPSPRQSRVAFQR